MEKLHRAIAVRKPRWLILVPVTFVTGVASGLGGMALALLLRLVQHFAYGHGLHTIVGRLSFLRRSLLPTCGGSSRYVRVAQSRGLVGGCSIVLVLRWFLSDRPFRKAATCLFGLR
jgi:hypothetical protein